MTDKTLDELRVERDKREADYRHFQRAVDLAAREAARKAEADVRKEHADADNKLREAFVAAHAVFTERLEAEATHPLAGQMFERQNPSWRAKHGQRQRAVLEVRKPSTVFSGNSSSYGRPALGEPFLRLLKSDGRPGLKHTRIYRFENGVPYGWTKCND